MQQLADCWSNSEASVGLQALDCSTVSLTVLITLGSILCLQQCSAQCCHAPRGSVQELAHSIQAPRKFSCQCKSAKLHISALKSAE